MIKLWTAAALPAPSPPPPSPSSFKPPLDTFEVWERPTDLPPPAPQVRPRRRLAKIGAVVGLALALGLGGLAVGQGGTLPAPPAAAAAAAQSVAVESAPMAVPQAPTGQAAVEAYGVHGAFTLVMLPQIPRYVTLPPYALITLMDYNSQGNTALEGNNYFNLPVSTPLSDLSWTGPSQDGMRVYATPMDAVADFSTVLRSKSFQQSEQISSAQTDRELFQALRDIGYLSPAQYDGVVALYQSQWGQ